MFSGKSVEEISRNFMGLDLVDNHDDMPTVVD
jgi:hypothetical protein